MFAAWYEAAQAAVKASLKQDAFGLEGYPSPPCPDSKLASLQVCIAPASAYSCHQPWGCVSCEEAVDSSSNRKFCSSRTSRPDVELIQL